MFDQIEQLMSLLTMGLATWRVSAILTEEAGPLNIFGRIRKAAGADVLIPVPGSLGDIMSCIYCLSVWVGCVFYLGQRFLPLFFDPFTKVMAMSAVALIVSRFLSCMCGEELPPG